MMEEAMRRNKVWIAFFVALVTYFSCISTIAGAGSDPVGLLQTIANSMVAGLKKNEATLKSKPDVVYKLAYTYVVPHADLDEMSKRVLPPQVWNSAAASQREEFKKQFTLTLIRTYASALSSYKDQSIKFYPVRGEYGNLVQVNSDIVNPESGAIHVTYQLIRTNGSWHLLDMNVEGIGMLDSFRSQFSDILSQGNMQQLLDKLSAHNNRRG
jgi:phospholipid transport system substrate-binding protein